VRLVIGFPRALRKAREIDRAEWRHMEASAYTNLPLPS
jgi:hypothetical protein